MASLTSGIVVNICSYLLRNCYLQLVNSLSILVRHNQFECSCKPEILKQINNFIVLLHLGKTTMSFPVFNIIVVY